jgi:hypothetical protein
MQSRMVAAMFAAGVFVWPGAAQADPFQIAAIMLDFRGGSPAEVAGNSGIFRLSMSQSVALFEDIVISEASIGTTLIANAMTDDDFAEVARRATNGAPNFVSTLFGPVAGGGGGSGFGSEGTLFGLSTPDFRGFTLTSFNLRVDHFSATPTGETPPFTTLALRGELSVFGEGSTQPAPVPEPGTLALLASGAAGLLGMRRRRRNARD